MTEIRIANITIILEVSWIEYVSITTKTMENQQLFAIPWHLLSFLGQSA